MATTTTVPTTIVEIPVDAIDVDEGTNPRTNFDLAAAAELQASITQHGVLQPIIVRAGDVVDRYLLVAGERRLRAATAVSLTTIPAVISHGIDAAAARHIATIENLIRRDLNPVEEARAYGQALATKGCTQKSLAQSLSVPLTRIRERLRLLRLPEATQQAVADGVLSLSAVPLLEAIAKVSPPVADATATLVRQGSLTVRDLDERPTAILRHVGENTDTLCIEVDSWSRRTVTGLGLPAELADPLIERADALDDFTVRFTSDDTNAARAFGCLIELKRNAYSSDAFLTDPGFVADRVAQQLDRAEKQARAATKSAAVQEQPLPSDEEKAARAEQREAQRVAVRQTHNANLALGRAALRRYHAPKLNRDIARLLATLVLAQDPAGLAARGLRYTREELQTVETRTLKDGTVREKITYLEPHEAEEALWTALDKAKSPEEILGLTVQALVAAYVADDHVVANSRRVHCDVTGRYRAAQIAGLLAKLAGPVTPEALTNNGGTPDEA